MLPTYNWFLGCSKRRALYSNYAQDFSSQFLRVNTYDRANRTITAIVDGHGNPIGPFILYDDGSMRMASGTIDNLALIK